jgi:hypothetical protein
MMSFFRTKKACLGWSLYQNMIAFKCHSLLHSFKMYRVVGSQTSFFVFNNKRDRKCPLSVFCVGQIMDLFSSTSHFFEAYNYLLFTSNYVKRRFVEIFEDVNRFFLFESIFYIKKISEYKIWICFEEPNFKGNF